MPAPTLAMRDERAPIRGVRAVLASGHVSSDALSGRGIPRCNLALGRLANQLINTTLREPRSDRHVVATQRVAQGPGVHEAVTHGVAIGDLILRVAQLVHVILLNFDRHARNWPDGCQVFIRQNGISVLLGHKRIISYSQERRRPLRRAALSL